MRALARIGSAFGLVMGVATAAAPQEVTLPLETYESLRHLANPTPPPEPAPPAPFALEASELTIEPAAASARITERLTLSIYADGFVTIPLSESGSVTSVELGTLEGRIATDGVRGLVVRGSGRHVVTVASVVSLVRDDEATRPTSTLAVGLVRAGVVTGSVVDTADIAELEVVSGGIGRPLSDTNDFRFVGQPGAQLELKLLGEERAPDRAALPLVFEALSATITTLSRTRLSATVYLGAEVVQGRLDALRVRLPDGLEVTRVNAKDVGWRREGDVLVVTPQVPVESVFRVNVDLEGEAVEELSSPVSIPLDAARATLVTAFVVDGDGIPTLADARTARRADPYELARMPSLFREAGAFVIPDATGAPLWSVSWSDTSQTEVLALQIDRLVVETVVGPSGEAGYQCWAYVRSSGATSVTLRFPDGFELAKASRDGVGLVPGQTPDGLEVPLGGSSETQIVLLSGVVPFLRAGERKELEIPVPSTSAPVAQAAVRAILPGGNRYVVADGHVDPVMRVADTPFSFVVPAGFALVEASWTALSAQPKPLTLEVEPLKRDKKWF